MRKLIPNPVPTFAPGSREATSSAFKIFGSGDESFVCDGCACCAADAENSPVAAYFRKLGVMPVHVLKIRRTYADAKLLGKKPFEIRKNDRDFRVGDRVRYRVVDERGKRIGHTLERFTFEIIYVLRAADGLEKDYVIYGERLDLDNSAL